MHYPYSRALGFLLLAALAGASARLPAAAAPAAAPARQLIVLPDDGRALLLQAIAAAERSLTLTIYEIGDPEIVEALLAAQRRGVAVRVIYNYYSFLHFGHAHENSNTVATLVQAGAHARRANPHFEVTHQKTLTCDGAQSFILTFNLRTNYFGGTRDFGVLTRDPDEVREIAAVFEADWAWTNAAPACPSLVWSPVNSRAKTLALIRGAQRTLAVYNEELADPESLAALLEAAQRGVAVRVICARLGREGSDEDRNAAGRDRLNAGGAAARTGTFLYIHAKMILADYGTPQAAVFLGSENFSRASLDRNRELGILLREPEILDRLHGVFESDWGRAAPPAE